MTNQNTNPDYYKGAEKTALVRLCGVLGVLTENNDLSTAALLAATRIERLEKKIPVLNVDLAEASMHAYNGEIARMKLETRIAELEAERRWIPVSERLPNRDGFYLILENVNQVAGYYHWCKQFGWNTDGGRIHIQTVTHWMPLPFPPESEA